MVRQTLRERMLADLADTQSVNQSWWTAEHEKAAQIFDIALEYDLAHRKYKYGERICPVSRYNLKQRWWEEPDI